MFVWWQYSAFGSANPADGQPSARWALDPETRLFSLQKETRLFSLAPETRLWTLHAIEGNGQMTVDTTYARNSVEKAAGDSLILTFDFSNALENGETLSSVNSVTCDDATVSASGETIPGVATTLKFDDRSDPVTVPANQGVQVRVSGGTVSATEATLTFNVTTSNGNTFDRKGLLKIS